MNDSLINIHDKVEAAILLSPHLRHKRLQIQSDGDNVRLTGKVETFFEKQMVQETIRRVAGVGSISNDVEVRRV